MSSRDSFLSRVRQAVKDGNRTGDAAPIPERGVIGYQGGGPNLLETFSRNCQAMGMKLTLVSSRDELLQKIAATLDAKHATRILLGSGGILASLDLGSWLQSTGRTTIAASAAKDELFAADASITAVTSLIAETGSLVVASSPEMTRTESLLPPVHIAIANVNQIEPDIFDVLEKYNAANSPPSNLVFITGPSKTGDIELKLVTGVHGPGEVHVLVFV